jgi:predicted nucleotidyltransferase
MQAVGIIAEYNPFHNGHHWHAEQARELSGCDGVIAVMSGNFLQRGEPASFDKWSRAKMAVRGGVDLILELPTVFAVRSAQYFAEGGIRLLASLGIVKYLCCGVETDNLALLKSAASSIKQDATRAALFKHMKEGMTYAKAFSLSVSTLTGIEHSILASPNNILAIEYLRALAGFAPDMIPLLVKRKQAQYHDAEITSPYASATAIRKVLDLQGRITDTVAKAIPLSTREEIEFALAQQLGPASYNKLSPLILYRLRSLSHEEIEEFPDITEGLHHKLSACALKASDLYNLLDLLKSKRYTRTRLQRLLVHVLLGTKKNNLTAWNKTGPLYARVLAFNDRGRALLRQISRQGSVPVITKTADTLNTTQTNLLNMTVLQKMLAVDFLASDIFVLTLPNPQLHAGGWDSLRSPIYIPS